MDAKDKAKELVEKYLLMENALNVVDLPYMTFSKQCALIACDFAKEFITGGLSESFDKFLYLEDVKEEINKL